jgi:hypothetical protein
VHAIAGQQSPDLATSFAARHAQECVQAGVSAEALSVLAAHARALALPALYELYQHIAYDVLAQVEDDDPASVQAIKDLRAFLRRLTGEMQKAGQKVG